MRIIHIVAGLWKDTGGPAEVIPSLCRAQSDAGANVTLCTIDGDNARQVDALRDSSVNVRFFPAVEALTRYSPTLSSYLRIQADIDVIHNHGQWLWPNWTAADAARKHGVALVTTPHGTLVPGMLRRARLKKALAWAAFDRRLIARANVIHALSEAERDGMAPKLGTAISKVVVIPNGVHVPAIDQRRVGVGQGHTLLFLSRLARIKGVLNLLDAWALLEREFPNWQLKMVGPIDPEIREEVEGRVARTERVVLYGPVYGDDRWQHYCAASAFVLPTLGEGLPTALLEAAAHRLPIITTREANFPSLAEAGGSVLCSPESASLEQCLRRVFSLSPEEREAIGHRGLELIRKNHDWSKVAEEWLSVYSRIIRNDER